MRFLKVLSVFVCLVAFCSIAAAKENKLGIRDSRRVSFDQPVRVGDAVIPAGDYIVRHTMEADEHIMIFRKEHAKDQIRVKCTLVALSHKADQDQASYQTNDKNERVLTELVFGGDTSKHVF